MNDQRIELLRERFTCGRDSPEVVALVEATGWLVRIHPEECACGLCAARAPFLRTDEHETEETES